MDIAAKYESEDEGVQGQDEIDVSKPLRRLKCSECDFTTSHRSSLSRHSQKHKESWHSCPKCPGKKFYTVYNLKDHEKNVHGDGLMCDHCCKMFKSRSGLLTHRRKIVGDYRFHCEICDGKFISKSHFEAHLNSHTGYKPHQCMKCKKAFGTKSSLNRHRDNCISDKDKSKCDTCNTMYSSEATLKAHYSGMHGNTVHRCDKCGNSYKWAASCYRHEQSHK